MSEKPGIRINVENLTDRIGKLSLSERWRLLLFLAARHPVDTQMGMNQIKLTRHEHRDITINSLTFDQETRTFSTR